MRAFRDPGAALSEVACATRNITRATFRSDGALEQRVVPRRVALRRKSFVSGPWFQ